MQIFQRGIGGLIQYDTRTDVATPTAELLGPIKLRKYLGGALTTRLSA